MSKPNTKRSFFATDAANQLPAALMSTSATKAVAKPGPRLQAQTTGQKGYIRKLSKNTHDILFVTGPAGCGKTYLAVVYALIEWQADRCDKIIITRPTIGAEEDLGFLPGSLMEKMAPWTIPVLDVFKEFMSVHEVEQMIRREEIEMASFAHMRGRTFKNAIIIADEAQNTTVGQMKMLLTRIGDNSRMIITGDMEQHDRRGEPSGLVDVIQRHERALRFPLAVNDDEEADANRREYLGLVRLGRADVVRHPAIDSVLKLYDDE